MHEAAAHLVWQAEQPTSAPDFKGCHPAFNPCLTVSLILSGTKGVLAVSPSPEGGSPQPELLSGTGLPGVGVPQVSGP